MGAAASRRQTTMTNDPDYEPHAVSPTGHILEELALYGHRPFDDEPDPRPLPEANHITGAIVDIFDALVVTLQDSRLEPDLETLLWDQFETHTPRLAPARRIDGQSQGADLRDDRQP